MSERTVALQTLNQQRGRLMVGVLAWMGLLAMVWSAAVEGTLGLSIGGLAIVTFVIAWMLSRLPWATRFRALSLCGVCYTAAAGTYFVAVEGHDAAGGWLTTVSSVMVATMTGWRWMVAHHVPIASMLFYQVSQLDQGVDALPDVVLRLVISITLGGVAAWLQHQSISANDRLVDARDGERTRFESDLLMRRQVADSVKASVSAVASAASGVERQSGQVASSVEQMAAAVRQTAAISELATTRVRDIAAAADEGQRLVDELGRAGTEINGVVEAISSLSSQTNLLALNATIEAARAGESGKGFAVVASEVKSLAQQTAQSAAGITDIVDEVLERVERSTAAMTRIARMIEDLEADQGSLYQAVMEQSRTIDDISSATSSGARSAAEIARSIHDIDRSTAALTG